MLRFTARNVAFALVTFLIGVFIALALMFAFVQSLNVGGM